MKEDKTLFEKVIDKATKIPRDSWKKEGNSYSIEIGSLKIRVDKNEESGTRQEFCGLVRTYDVPYECTKFTLSVESKDRKVWEFTDVGAYAGIASTFYFYLSDDDAVKPTPNGRQIRIERTRESRLEEELSFYRKIQNEFGIA